MIYRQVPFRHSNFLNNIIYNIYEIKTDGTEYTYTTAPNGIIGLSIVLDGHAEIWNKNNWNPAPSVSIYGLIKRPGAVKNIGNYREIALGFKPYYLSLLVDESMNQLAGGHSIDAAFIFGQDEIDRMISAIQKTDSDLSLIHIIENFLLRKFKPEMQNLRLMTAMNLIYSGNHTKVENLAESLNMSTVTLRNQFRDRIGVTPKDLIRITRIQKALSSNLEEHKNLTELSYHLGFFDQAHFIHDFKEVIGLNPGTYFGSKKLVFDFYNYGRWEGNILGPQNN